MTRSRGVRKDRGTAGLPASRSLGVFLLLALPATLMASGCGGSRLSLVADADSSYTRAFTDPATLPRQARLAPSASFGFPWVPHLRWRSLPPDSKLHPRLLHWIAAGDTARPIRVLVGFRDRAKMERLPVEGLSHPLSFPGIKFDSSALALPNLMMARRAPRYLVQNRRLRFRFGAPVLDSLWISQCSLVETTAGRVRAIASWSEVVSIVPRETGSSPPQTSNPADEEHPIREARDIVGSDLYVEAGYGNGHLRLIDTGVTPVHETFDGLGPTSASLAAGPALALFDCIESAACTGTSVDDTQLPGGHGTGTAAIVVGRGSPAGDPHTRGVVDAALDQCRAYWIQTDGTLGFDPLALAYGLQSHPERPTPVVAIQAQDPSGSEGQVSILANQAFAAGACVIATIGNFGAVNPLFPRITGPMAPGSARWAIATGCRQVYEPLPGASDGQSHGVVDGRTKPDLQFPTYTTSAGISGRVSKHVMDMTSGALPYAASAALILRNFLGPLGGTVDPGQVYSMLLACGEMQRDPATRTFPVTLGAGLVRLPSAGIAGWGADDLLSFSHKDHTFDITDPTLKHFRVALWWADPDPAMLFGGALDVHFDFDVELERLDHPEKVASTGVDGVFERAAYHGTTDLTGTWRVRVHARNVGLSRQRVYWSFVATP